MALRKIEAMYHYYGQGTGKCMNCPHFDEQIWDRTYFKCRVYGTSHAESTDWRKNWQACGLIDKPFPEDDKRIVDLVNGKKDDEPLPGQMTMFDEVVT